MKRFTTIILAMAMILSLVGCSSDKSGKKTVKVTKKDHDDDEITETSEEDEDETTTSAADPTTETTAEPEPTDTEATTAAPEPELPAGAISFEYDQYCVADMRDDDEYYGSRIQANYTPVHITDSNYQALSDAVETYNDMWINYVDISYESLKVFYDMDRDETYYGTSYVTNTVYRADSLIFSIATNEYFSDSMNPSLNDDVYIAANYWSATGESVLWDEVFADKEALKDILFDVAYYKDDTIDVDITKDYIDSCVENETLQYAITINGIIAYVNVQNSYYDYTMEVNIPYIWNENIFVADIFEERVVDDFVIPFNYDNSLTYDVDNNGIEEYFYVGGIEDDYGITSLVVYCEEASCEVEAWCYAYESYLVHCGGSTYIWVIATGDSDCDYLNVFDVTSGEPVFVEELYCGLFYTPSPYYMFVTSRINPLSTTTGYLQCTPGDDGLPAFVTDRQILMYPVTLLSITDIDASIVDPIDGSVLGSTVIPADSVVKIIATDNDSYVDLYVEGSDELIRLNVDLEWTWDGDKSGQMVDGMFADDCFAGVMYAG